MAVILLIIVAVFALQNFETVDVAFLTWSMSMPKIVLILGTFAIGAVVGWVGLALAKWSNG
jgi:uncharacterized integral membrane protein